MTLRIGVVSQKGGVGKSAIARTIACEYAKAGWHVKIADLDLSQGTSFNWNSRRLQQGLTPPIAVEQFATIEGALRVADAYDLIVFDGAPHSTQTTLQIAHQSHLVILPTGMSLDDLEPTIRLAHELKQKGVPASKIAIALCRVGDSPAEMQEATDYLHATGYRLLDGTVPERTGYRRAMDTGRTLTETSYPSLNQKADDLIQAIVNTLTQLEPQEASNGNHSQTNQRGTPARKQAQR